MYLHDQSTPAPPAPGNPDEARRWEHTRHRRSMMEGRWLGLLEARLEAQLGTVRRTAWGIPDISANPYRVCCTELATLYDAQPDVRHNQIDSENVQTLIGSDGMIARTGLWAQMSRFQAMTIALREMWMFVSVEDGRIIYEPVPPDMTIAEADPARPTIPTMVGRLRLRHVEGRLLWTWDVFDIRDPINPYYRVYEAGDGGKFLRDLTVLLHGRTYEGAEYPYRRQGGAPVLPAVLYHASQYGDRLFDPYYGIELYEGSLNLAVLYSYLNHCLRDASYPQRYAVGVRVSGMDLVDGGSRAARAEVTTDPTTILMLDPVSETSQPMIGQYQAGADVEKLESVIAAVAHRLATDAGLAPSELQRTSGSARSGYAISLSQEGKRSAQRRYVMQQRGADEALIGLTAVLFNRWSEANAEPTNYPEGGYSVLYREIPLSGDELEARRKHIVEMMAAGLMDKVEALRFFGSLSEQDAVAKLAAIREMEAEAPPQPPEEGTRMGEAAPAAPVTVPETAEAVDELRASEEAIDGILDAANLTPDQRAILDAVLESLREARGYLTGQEVEAKAELPGEIESETVEDA